MNEVLTLDKAEDLAARTLSVIDALSRFRLRSIDHERIAADREPVASDLAGLRDALAFLRIFDSGGVVTQYAERNARRYSDGLRRTARLYGVTP